MDYAVRKGGGKQKGSQFEREVCVLLSKWLTKDEREDVFWRSAMSGGRATVAAKTRGKKLSTQVGDISCIHPAGHKFSEQFAIECKFYANLDYQGLITGKGKLTEFWREIKQQARAHKKNPILIARQNRMQSMVCLDIQGRKELGLIYRDMILICVTQNLHVISAENFFKITKPYV